MKRLMLFVESVFINIRFYALGEGLHGSTQGVDKRGVGFVRTVGAHLLLAACGGLGALEIQADVIKRRVGISIGL